MITVLTATPGDLEDIRVLFREYADSLGVDLGYQGFEDELAQLPGAYAPPGGTLLLARGSEGTVGCVGVRPFEPGIAEMKRLYVRDTGRGLGVGRRLAEAAIRFARGAGYRCMRLDTLPQMTRARDLYAALGFRAIEPYRYSAVPGTAFLELRLLEDSRSGKE